MKNGNLVNLSSGDALAAGHTLRALAHREYPNPSAAEVLARVGDWLVAASTKVSAPAGPIAPLNVRASELITGALQLGHGDQVEAMSALLAAMTHLALNHSRPRHALSLFIDTLTPLRDECALPAEAASS